MTAIVAALPGFLLACTALIWNYLHAKNHPHP
jgi:hypothetical protein